MGDALKVLIVDDSKLVLRQLEAIIDKNSDVELVGTAQDGAGAIRSVSHFKPDLVLMDIVMPGMDGISALRVICATQPDTRVAMVTSVGGASKNAEEAFRLGAIQVISKPFDAEQIEAVFISERAYRAERGS